MEQNFPHICDFKLIFDCVIYLTEVAYSSGCADRRAMIGKITADQRVMICKIRADWRAMIDKIKADWRAMMGKIRANRRAMIGKIRADRRAMIGKIRDSNPCQKYTHNLEWQNVVVC